MLFNDPCHGARQYEPMVQKNLFISVNAEAYNLSSFFFWFSGKFSDTLNSHGMLKP